MNALNDDSNTRGRRWPDGATLGYAERQAIEQSPLSGHDLIYTELRRMILTGRIRPGDWLRQVEIAKQFGVSRTPVREAFRTLSRDGLVELIPNHGAWVLSLSVEEFEEIYALRIGIEGLAAKLVAEQATEEQIDKLETKLDRLRSEMNSLDLETYLVREWQFRISCFSILSRRRLLQRILSLREESERYIPLAYNVNHKRIESFAFHSRLLSAIKDHDARFAESIVQDALKWTLANATKSVLREIKKTENQKRSIFQVLGGDDISR